MHTYLYIYIYTYIHIYISKYMRGSRLCAFAVLVGPSGVLVATHHHVLFGSSTPFGPGGNLQSEPFQAFLEF